MNSVTRRRYVSQDSQDFLSLVNEETKKRSGSNIVKRRRFISQEDLNQSTKVPRRHSRANSSSSIRLGRKTHSRSSVYSARPLAKRHSDRSLSSVYSARPLARRHSHLSLRNSRRQIYLNSSNSSNSYGNNIDVFEVDADEETEFTVCKANILLMEACKSGDFQKVKKFLADGADIYYVDSVGCTSFHYAALKGHENILEAFLNHEIDVNIRCKDNQLSLL